MRHRQVTIDGNEAAARIAHLCNEVIAIYPITPASPMGEWADEWSSTGVRNLWDTVPQVIEMQSEAGAAGAIHGALQAGALATSFTASQGLLLMIPNMYKIAGELTPTVLHVAARSLAVQALSIFGDHSDVMACRSTGYAMLCSASVQEVQDFALIAQAATLSARIPFLHFFDGFRTSHEIDKISEIGHETARALIDEDLVIAHRRRALSPDRPVLRGTSQNPDVYFQGRESVNRYYEELPEILDTVMHRFGDLTGRRYRLFEYSGVADAEHAPVVAAPAVELAVGHRAGGLGGDGDVRPRARAIDERGLEDAGRRVRHAEASALVVSPAVQVSVGDRTGARASSRHDAPVVAFAHPGWRRA